MDYEPNINYSAYLSQKAKVYLRKFNDTYRDGKTEVLDERHMQNYATNIHHIFPEADYPQISMFCENLIALTPTQHYNYAHPNAHTQRIDPHYQHICLIAKASSVKENLENTEQAAIYEFGRLKTVLATGFDDEAFIFIDDMDFDGLIQRINSKYDPTAR